MSNTVEEMLKTIKPFCTCGMDDNMHETNCMMYQLAFAFKEVKHLREIEDNAMIPCDKCGGGGFAHAGTGYDDVCDDCSGGYTGYATGQELADLRARVTALEATHVALNAMIHKVAEQETKLNQAHEHFKKILSYANAEEAINECLPMAYYVSRRCNQWLSTYNAPHSPAAPDIETSLPV